jgi:hypothetical protein
VATVTNTTYADTNLLNNTTYYYVVTAVDSGGASINSPEASTTPSVGAGLPLIWSGAANANWDINTTANWVSNGVSALYQDGKAVQFHGERFRDRQSRLDSGQQFRAELHACRQPHRRFGLADQIGRRHAHAHQRDNI